MLKNEIVAAKLQKACVGGLGVGEEVSGDGTRNKMKVLPLAKERLQIFSELLAIGYSMFNWDFKSDSHPQLENEIDVNGHV